MRRPTQVGPLFAGAAGLWFLHLIFVVSGPERDEAVDRASPLLAAALANIAFWLGLLLAGAALLLLVLVWHHRWAESGESQVSGLDHYE